ncbi:hypothetical protein HPC49_14555 [Pyxidicoccus fallax]|uniref:Response regulatory domain-containing protein n=1 Tax=Pyxidicoccus fallax TaxID=394095 RepID=A0A848LMV7_9BACT|nr:hypothetical protein [Pyxidicoccus fallax]NMO18953.1 hypothetical protein [Pyxidicoccus fallax]NPC79452.1 hypothetical protein [Pyxidicoccus fallax]
MLSDNTRLRDTLTRGLNRHRFEVLATSHTDLGEFLRTPASRRTQVQVLLLDVSEGAASGAARMLSDLRANGVDVPVVAIAAPRDSGELGASPSARNTTVLIKPIDLAELAAELARWTG